MRTTVKWSLIILLILVFGCQKQFTDKLEDIEYEYGELKYPGTTHILDNQDVASLVEEYSQNTGLIKIKQNEKTVTIDEGHILMMGPSGQTPFGALRKVVDVSEDGGILNIQTVQADLSEAVIEGELEANFNLGQNDIYATVETMDGVSLKSASVVNAEMLHLELDHVNLTGDDDYPVIVDGELVVDINPVVNFNFHLGRKPDIKMDVDITLEEDFSFDASCEYLSESDPVPVFEAYFNPIVLWGIVLIPKLELIVGMNGHLEASLSAASEQSMEKHIDLDYVDGILTSEESDWITTSKSGHLSVNAKAGLDSYFGPKLSILVFGLVGPYVSLTGHIDLEANINANPWWWINSYMEVEVGLNGDIIGVDDEIDPYVFPSFPNPPWVLAEAEGGFVNPALLCTITGKILEADDSTPINNVEVSIYKGNPNFSGQKVAASFTGSNGNYEIKVAAGDNYYIHCEKEGYISKSYKIQEDVTVGGIIYEQLNLLIDNTYSGVGDFGGKITNAFTGDNLGSVTVTLYEGQYITSGTPVKTTTTDSYGAYLFQNIAAGYYTVVLSKAGYINSQFNVAVLGGVSQSGMNGTITPIISDSEWRIILTWGASPEDIDSHITGPVNEYSSDRFHVYWRNMSYSYSNFSTNLDVDDVNSYGPETITLKNIANGVYRFSVHDYSNRNSSYSISLASSGAAVVVYNGSGVVARFNVPPEEGTLWTVFEIRNKSFYPVDIMEYEDDTDNVKSGTINKTDSYLIKNMPLKEK